MILPDLRPRLPNLSQTALAACGHHAICCPYMAKKVGGRATAKVFTTGRGPAVRIPKKYRFACEEVLIERDDDRLILTPTS
jgi:hypothetical protein